MLIVDEIVGVIGHEAASALFETYGGCVLYTPTPDNLRDGWHIAETIGQDKALKL